jgi:formamidopyrimidine-DNA glycosylase
LPELPEVEAVRRELEPFLVGARIDDVEVRRPDLRASFPGEFRSRLAGRRVTSLTRRAKYLMATLSSGETLLMHLGMSGSFRVSPSCGAEAAAPRAPGPDERHDHVVFHMSSGAVVTFNDPRRFGLMDLLGPGALDAHPVLGRLGPEPLSPEFDAAALARACAGRKTPLKIALLDQRVVAGVGNIYASEALHVALLSPLRRAGTIATPAGTPRPHAYRLAAAVKQVLSRAILRVTAPNEYRGSAFRVYDREGMPCPRPRCHGTVRRRAQGGRSSFYCPVCQR